MLDEIETTETTAVEAREPFDLDAAVTAYIAQHDQERAAKREALERKEREDHEAACADLWEFLEAALPSAAVRAAFGITGAEWDARYSDPHVVARVGDMQFNITRWGRGFEIVIRDHYHERAYDETIYEPGDLQAGLIRAAAWMRRRQAERVAVTDDPDTDQETAKSAPAKTWEPQVLGQDSYRTTYLLDVDRGCGSINQHALTLAEVNKAGDVLLSTMYPGRANDPDNEPIVDFHISAAQLRALWPLWQTATADKSAEETEKLEETGESAAFADMPL